VLAVNILIENPSDGLHRGMGFRGQHELKKTKQKNSELKSCKTSSILAHEVKVHFTLKDILGRVEENMHV
jgi:hypothetical protein